MLFYSISDFGGYCIRFFATPFLLFDVTSGSLGGLGMGLGVVWDSLYGSMARTPCNLGSTTFTLWFFSWIACVYIGSVVVPYG